MIRIIKGILGGCLGLLCAYYVVQMNDFKEETSNSKELKIVKHQKQSINKSKFNKHAVCSENTSCNSSVAPMVKVKSKAQKNYDISKKLNHLISKKRSFDLSKETLGKVLKEEIKASFVPANFLLQEQKQYEFAFKEAEHLKTELIQEFLYSYSYPKLLEEGNNRELRNNLIVKYLRNKEQVQIIHTVGALNQISFNQNEVLKIKEAFCSLNLPTKNEAQIALHYKFNNFLLKYNEKKC